MNISIIEATLRLLAAAALSGVIGLEREVAQKNAGLRTHMLVGLGAGAIFRHGLNVKGLTTAAGLWTVAAVGMAAGVGWYAVALAATLVAIVVLYVFWVVEWLLRGRSDQATGVIEVSVDHPDAAERVAGAADDLVGRGGRVAIHEIAPDGAVIRVFIDPKRANAAMVSLRAIEGVIRVTRGDA